jgi:PAS domain S-box-containing protein
MGIRVVARSMELSSVPRSWRNADLRLFWQVLLVLALLISAGVALTIKVELTAHLDQDAAAQKARLERRVAIFSSRINDILTDLKVVAGSSRLQHYLDHGDPADLEALRQDFSVFIESKQIFDQARFIDQSGKERVRVDLSGQRAKVIPDEQLQNKGSRYYFTDTVKLHHGETYISPFDLNIEGSQIELPFKPMIRLATPLFNSHDQLRGIAIVNYLGNDLLRRLNPSDQEVPQIELLNRDGYWLKGASPDREWGFMFNRPENFGTMHADIWRVIREVPSGQARSESTLWTWSRIYPLRQELRSSTGSSQATGTSATEVGASDYYWIAVSGTPSGWHGGAGHGIVFRYGLAWLVAMCVASMGSWMLALRQGWLNAANKDLVRKRRVAEIVNRFQQSFIDEPEPGVPFDKLLREITAFTDSESGFVGEVLQDEQGNDYLKCYAVGDIVCDSATRSLCEEDKSTGLVFRNLDTLFGHVITGRAAVIANDPADDPRYGGIPEGHPAIRTFLGAPIWYGSRLVGEIGLANRLGGYDTLVLDELLPVLESCGHIVVTRWEREARREAERAEADARRASEAAQQRIELLLESVGEGVCGVDLQGRITFINAAARRLLGWREDEGIGLGLHDSTHHHRADGQEFPRIECPIYQTKLDGAPRFVADDWYWRKDGSGFPVEYTAAAIWYQGKIVGAVNVFRDITQRKQTELELEAYRSELEEKVKARTVELRSAKEAAETANVAKSAFLANMSHEMRTPLHQVIELAELIRREALTPTQAGRLDKLEAASHKLTGLIEAILELTKIEAGQLDLVAQPFDLAELLAGVISLVQPQALPKDLRLQSEAINVPARLVGDKEHIQQALLNYVSNAIRFSEARTVTLRVKLAAEIGSNLLVRFEVEDDGVGIDTHGQARLFSIFEQVEDLSGQNFGGLGVGLATTKKLAEIMGGDAGCTSSPGHGSTFWFTARLAKA